MKVIPLYPDSPTSRNEETEQPLRTQIFTNHKFNHMKSLLITIVALAMTFSLYSQTVYTLNGKLGVGRVPEAKLDVDGDAIIRGDLFALGNTTLQLSTVVGQDLYLPNLSPVTTGDIILRGGDGRIRVAYPKDFHNLIQPKHFDCSGSLNSYWQERPGILNTQCLETNVGIGTDSPQHRLDVDGDANITDNLHIGSGTVDNSYKLHVSSGNSGGIRIEGNTNTGVTRNALAYSDNGTLRYQLYSTGTIETKLSEDAWGALYIKNYLGDDIFRVNERGGVTCSKVTVHMVPFPDYVFEKDYKLMPLKELEQYIQRNKHLPNMPSSTEVAKNGADLGEINRVLVEKVEELTLYILDLEKRMNTLEKVSVNK